MAGVILMTAMLACGISLWLKRRKDRLRLAAEERTFSSADVGEMDLDENCPK